MPTSLHAMTGSIQPKSEGARALDDIVTGFKTWRVWGYIAWNDIRQRYRRSTLGPLWLTLSMAIMVFAIGALYSRILKTDVASYLPFFCTSILIWTFISTVISESCNAFIQSEALIKQLSLPFSTHVLRVLWRNLIVLLHHLLIYALVALYFAIPVLGTIWQVVPGALLLLLNLAWIGYIIGIVCARYRDVPLIVQSILQVMIFFTPILWKPDQLSPNMHIVVDMNPFYHLIEILRAPMLGHDVRALSWEVTGGMLIVGWMALFVLLRRYRRRIAYWL